MGQLSPEVRPRKSGVDHFEGGQREGDRMAKAKPDLGFGGGFQRVSGVRNGKHRISALANLQYH